MVNRRDAVAALLQDRGDLLVVTGLGSPSYDAHAAGDHAANFYLWGAMGAAALLGLGLAQAQPGRRVLVITGDGEQLMGLGGLATIGIKHPDNLSIAVLDNEQYGETGQQSSHTGQGVDLVAVARACGFPSAGVANTLDGVQRLRPAIHGDAPGPRFYVIRVGAEPLPRSLPVRDAVWLKNRFRHHLGFSPS